VLVRESRCCESVWWGGLSSSEAGSISGVGDTAPTSSCAVIVRSRSLLTRRNCDRSKPAASQARKQT
jgi:hypothetical protein